MKSFYIVTPKTLTLILVQVLLLPQLVSTGTAQEQTTEWTAERLWKSVRAESSADVQAALAAGVDVNSLNEYGATALHFAADRGNTEIAEILLEGGADPLIKDRFYNASPLSWARQKGNQSLELLMLSRIGARVDPFLLEAVEAGRVGFVKSLLEMTKPSTEGLTKARNAAWRRANAESEPDNKFQTILDLFVAIGLEPFQPPALPAVGELKKYAGRYQADAIEAEIFLEGEELKIKFASDSSMELVFVSENEFSINGAAVKFELDPQQVVNAVSVQMGSSTVRLLPVAAAKTDPNGMNPAGRTDPKIAIAGVEDPQSAIKFPPSSPQSLAADLAISSTNWPSFRGSGARGVAEGQNPPLTWNLVEESSQLKWKTPIEGLGLSSPSIWENQIYLTSAVSEAADQQLKIGLYGDVSSVKEDAEYRFYLYCLDKQTGELLWKKQPVAAKPAVLRHAKSSHANPTVATDAQHVVAFFGSEGLYCYNHQGDLLWSKELGFLDSGWFYDPSYQWGFGSSPIIYQDRVIVQCDIQENSFIAAFDLSTGNELWRTPREEIPSWSTPTIHNFGELPMLITHATKSARGYDARDGKLLWSLGKHSEIVVPTPFVAHDLIFIASGYSPVQPIVAIRPTARGELSLIDGGENEGSEDSFIAWSKLRHGPYMPTPIVYGDYLYSCSNNGILRCFVATTGEEVYQHRLRAPGGGLAFTASPLAADGHLYLTAEDGRVLVIKAGPDFELVATNPCGENVLATPAISEGMMFIRSQNHLMAISH
jgi:outer membrane protein assembly factor BamB